MTKERTKELTLIMWKRLRNLGREIISRADFLRHKQAVLAQMVDTKIITLEEYGDVVGNGHNCFLCTWVAERDCLASGCPLDKEGAMCSLYNDVWYVCDKTVVQHEQKYVQACDRLIAAVEAW
jgi:hypothetical protein